MLTQCENSVILVILATKQRINSDMSFKVIATPALNKQGFAKLTFKGFKEVPAVYDKDTGEQVKRDYVKLTFSIMDTTRKNPIEANIIGGALTGRFLETLNALGFELPKSETTEDEDGFETEIGELADDGFEIDESNPDELIESLRTHLNTIIGKIYIAKVEKSKRGYWEIKTDTISVMGSKK